VSGDSFMGRRVFVAVLSALAVAMCKESPPIERLARATREAGRRQTEARLWGLPCVPYVAPARGAIGEVRGAAAETLIRSNDRHIRGVATLIVGDSLKAIETLAAVASERGGDPRVWSDLAAARYEHAREKDDVAELVWALAAANHALAINAAMPEAALNRAMILEELQLETLAKRRYTSYLTFERDPEWAAEGRRRLAALEALAPSETWKTEQPKLEAACVAGRQAEANAIAASYPQDARSWAEMVYLARWGEGVEKGDASATTWLTTARCIGVAMQAFSGEQLLPDAVEAIDRSKDKRVLAHAHVVYMQARAAYIRRALAEASPLFAEARAAFQRGRSSMEWVVRYFEGNVAYDRNDSAEALALLDAVAAAAPSSYRSLHANVDWERCLALNRLGRTYEALMAAERSVSVLDALGEHNSATRVRMSVATLSAKLGRPGDAWRVRRDLFRHASRTQDFPVLEIALNAAAADELRAGRWETAAAVYRELGHLPSISNIVRADALLWSALARGRAGLRDDALTGVAAAKTAALAIADADLRQAAIDEIRFAEAILIGEHDPQGATERLTEVIAFRRAKQLVSRLPEALVARSTLRRRAGDDPGAITDLDEAIAILAALPPTIEHNLRDSFFGTAAAAFDEAIALQAVRGNHDRAFALAEQSLDRALLARLVPGTTSAAKTLAETSAQLPADAAIVQFTSLPQQTLVIVIRRHGHRAALLGIDRKTIDARRSALVDAIARSDGATLARESRALFDALIAPLASDLRGVETLAIAADVHIAAIPFAVLRDGVTNQYLIERHAIAIAAGAGLSVQMHERAMRLTAPRTALVFGDPAFDETRFPSLPRLPGAREEALQVAELYPRAVPLVGADASKTRFLESAPSADVIHLAAHGIDNEADPLLSAIPFAATRTDGGVLSVREAAELRLMRSPVVVLTACRGAARSASSRPIRNFALAFAAAGSRAVIGSLWDVDDDTARALAIDVHRELRAGTPPAAALRHAQLMMMRSADAAENSPRAWSGFQSFGTD